MLKPIFTVIARDLRLALRRRSDIASVLFFFIIVASLFPLGVGPEPEQLRKLAPGVLWVAALLATMLSLPRLFADDYRDGTLEQLALCPQPLDSGVKNSSRGEMPTLKRLPVTVSSVRPSNRRAISTSSSYVIHRG